MELLKDCLSPRQVKRQQQRRARRGLAVIRQDCLSWRQPRWLRARDRAYCRLQFLHARSRRIFKVIGAVRSEY
jgi:hypothetical protein